MKNGQQSENILNELVIVCAEDVVNTAILFLQAISCIQRFAEIQTFWNQTLHVLFLRSVITMALGIHHALRISVSTRLEFPAATQGSARTARKGKFRQTLHILGNGLTRPGVIFIWQGDRVALGYILYGFPLQYCRWTSLQAFLPIVSDMGVKYFSRTSAPLFFFYPLKHLARRGELISKTTFTREILKTSATCVCNHQNALWLSDIVYLPDVVKPLRMTTIAHPGGTRLRHCTNAQGLGD